MLNPVHCIARRLRALEPCAEARAGCLRFVLLAGSSPTPADYQLYQADDELVSISELNHDGVVDRLRLDNGHPKLLLLLGGTALIGAKQNRALNTDVLAPAHSSLELPVSCIEQGRWRWRHARMAPLRAEKLVHFRLRRRKQARVALALSVGRGHDADQAAVWDDVEETLADYCPASPTRALHDAYRPLERAARRLRRLFADEPRAVGLLVVSGDRPLALDVFDQPTGFRHYREALLESYAPELHQPEPPAGEGAAADKLLRSLRRQLRDARWTRHEPVGAGVDLRLRNEQLQGAALATADGCLVHLQVHAAESC